MERKECKTGEFQKNGNTVDKSKRPRNFTTNLFLLVSGLVVSVSGLVIQIHYHVGRHPDASAVLFLDRAAWNSVHVWASACFLFVVAYHVRTHRKWYGNVFRRKRSPKTRPTLVLTCLTVVVAVSGFVPLLAGCFGGGFAFRSAVVEVHDKLAVAFLAIVFLHARKRWNRRSARSGRV